MLWPPVRELIIEMTLKIFTVYFICTNLVLTPVLYMFTHDSFTLGNKIMIYFENNEHIVDFNSCLEAFSQLHMLRWGFNYLKPFPFLQWCWWWKFLWFQIDVLVNRSRWQRSVFLKLSPSFKFPLKVRYFYLFKAQVCENGTILACYGLNCLAGVLPKSHENL